MESITKITIYEDTRQKANKHKTKNNYWKNNNVKVVRVKLEVGDYMLDLNGKVSIDTKQNILELANNMFCDTIRFEKECIRAKNKGILLIFLIEEKFDKQQLLDWKAPLNVSGNRFLNVFGWQILAKMKEYGKLFNVKFRCCHKLSSGKTIITLLKYYSQEDKK